jgi:hypothetical protein
MSEIDIEVEPHLLPDQASIMPDNWNILWGNDTAFDIRQALQ